MKRLAAAVPAFAWALALAGPARPDQPPAAPPLPVPDLRQAVQQYHPGTGAGPRQLTAAERAQLRRQLTEFGQPAPAPRGR